MKTPSAIILAIGLIVSSMILSNGFKKVATAIQTANSRLEWGHFDVKVSGDDQKPLSLKQANK